MHRKSSAQDSTDVHAALDQHRTAHGPACQGRDMCLVLAPDVIPALRDLADERNLRRLSIRTTDGGHLLEIPLKLGLAPRHSVWKALAALADAEEQFIVRVERVDAWPTHATSDAGNWA